jgi:hypothetical protein
MALSQQNQAREGFWSGLAGVAQALHPGRVTPGMVKAIAGPQGQDAGSLFNNLIQLQQYQQQNQALQAYRQNLPGMLEAAGIDKRYLPLAMADPSFMTKVAEAQVGVGGGPAWMAQQRAEKALTAQGKPIPWTPGDPSSYDAYTKAQTGEAVTTSQTQAKDLHADQHNFPYALGNYDNMIKDSEALLNEPGLDNIVGGVGQFNKAGNPLNSPETTRALALYDKIMASQYAAGVQDFKGAGRITQTELKTDAPSQSIMGSRNLDPTAFRQGVQDYINKLKQKRANLFGLAQKGDDPRLSDEDYAKYVAPNQDIYGGPKRDIKPSDSSSGGAGGGKQLSADDLAQAKTLMGQHGRDWVIKYLQGQGYKTDGL